MEVTEVSNSTLKGIKIINASFVNDHVNYKFFTSPYGKITITGVSEIDTNIYISSSIDNKEFYRTSYVIEAVSDSSFYLEIDNANFFYIRIECSTNPDNLILHITMRKN